MDNTGGETNDEKKDENHPKPILKTESDTKPDKKKKKAKIVWDEENLLYNETHRTATMKIDEPPTPYNRDYASSDNDESSQGEELSDKSGKKENFFDDVANKLETNDTTPKFKILEQEMSEDEKKQKEEFKEKRKKHYNEFEAVKKWREQSDEE